MINERVRWFERKKNEKNATIKIESKVYDSDEHSKAMTVNISLFRLTSSASSKRWAKEYRHQVIIIKDDKLK